MLELTCERLFVFLIIVSLCIYICFYMCICMCVYAYVMYICMYECIYVCMCMYLIIKYIVRYIYIYMYMYIYIYMIYIYINKLLFCDILLRSFSMKIIRWFFVAYKFRFHIILWRKEQIFKWKKNNDNIFNGLPYTSFWTKWFFAADIALWLTTSWIFKSLLRLTDLEFHGKKDGGNTK